MDKENNSKTIYLDNAATTFPKPESVYTEMDYVNRNLAVNTGRGSYSLARKATEIIDRTRESFETYKRKRCCRHCAYAIRHNCNECNNWWFGLEWCRYLLCFSF